MATSTYKKLSDEIIEHKCLTCYKKNRVRKSEKFCLECHSLFCSNCLEHHNFLHGDHTLLEPSQTTGQGMMPTDRCRTHPTKLVDSYCKDHGDVGCNTCAFEKHRSCKEVLYIPNEVERLFKKEELKQTKAEIDSMLVKFSEGKRLRDRHMKLIQTEKEKQLSVLEFYVETLVTMIRNLGKIEKKKLMNKFQEKEDLLHQDLAAYQRVETQLQKYRAQLDGNDENDAQMFITIINSQKCLPFAAQTIQDIQETTKHKSPKFKPDRQIEQYLAGLQSLGSVVDKSRIGHQSLVGTLPQLYKVGQRQDIGVKIKGDKSSCNICGLCLLPDGSLLLSDNNNLKLKRLDTATYKVIDHCSLPSNPRGVCCINPLEAAVCLENNTIQFVSLSHPKMALTRSFQLNSNCYGVCYRNSKLCVSNYGDDVLFFTLSGSLIKPGNLGLSSTWDITCDHSKNALYLADYIHGLVGVDMSGQKIFRFSDPRLNGCASVCVNGSGSLFVGGVLSGNVIQVTEDGKLIGEVVPRTVGITYPRSLSFDCSNTRLFVAGESDTLSVFQLK